MLTGMAHAHSSFLQSKQSQGQPSSLGQGAGKPQLELIAVLRRINLDTIMNVGSYCSLLKLVYIGSSGMIDPVKCNASRSML